MCITTYTYIADNGDPCQQFCNHDLISIVSDDSVLMVVLSQEEQRPPVLEERMSPRAFLVIYRIVTEGISVLYWRIQQAKLPLFHTYYTLPFTCTKTCNYCAWDPGWSFLNFKIKGIFSIWHVTALFGGELIGWFSPLSLQQMRPNWPTVCTFMSRDPQSLHYLGNVDSQVHFPSGVKQMSLGQIYQASKNCLYAP